MKFLLCLFLAVFTVSTGLAVEEIRSFSSRIEVLPDSDILSDEGRKQLE